MAVFPCRPGTGSQCSQSQIAQRSQEHVFLLPQFTAAFSATDFTVIETKVFFFVCHVTLVPLRPFVMLEVRIYPRKF
jgi:hypothetical protein